MRHFHELNFLLTKSIIEWSLLDLEYNIKEVECYILELILPLLSWFPVSASALDAK